MKRILILKRIDLYGQIALPLAFAFLSGQRALHCLLFLLGCQVFSCLVNELFLKGVFKSVVRRTYEIIFVSWAGIFCIVYAKSLNSYDTLLSNIAIQFTENLDYKILIILFSPIVILMYFMLSVEEIGIISDEIESRKKR